MGDFFVEVVAVNEVDEVDGNTIQFRKNARPSGRGWCP
jgi:hypothetical protein